MRILKPKRSPLTWFVLCFGVALSLAATLVVRPLLADVPGVIPAIYFSVPDSEGANNGPGQKDLTLMGWYEDKGDIGDLTDDVLDMFWNWDEITVNGNNTLDACALFDTDSEADGLINLALCGTVEKVNGPSGGMFLKSITVYTCSNAKNDRCTNPALQPTPSSTNVMAGAMVVDSLGALQPIPANPHDLLTNTDPFPAGAGYPQDTTLRVRALRSYLNGLVTGSMALLTNVCSYPSQQPNSDPSDCNNPPGGGFLKIVKDAVPDNSTLTFNFNVISYPTTLPGGTYPCPSPGGCNTTAKEGAPAQLALLIGTADVEEKSIPTDWSLDNAVCVFDGDGSAGGSFSSPKYSGVNVASGLITVCTFTNKRDQGKLTVTKVLSPDTGDKFKLFIKQSTTTVDSKSNVGNNDSLGPDNLNTGSYDVSEEADGATDMTDYTSTYSCKRQGETDPFTGGTGTSVTISILKGDDITCTFTNTQKAGTLVISKIVDNDADPDSLVAKDFQYKVDSGSATNFPNDNSDGDNNPKTATVSVSVSPGVTHSVTEPNLPSNYSAVFSLTGGGNCTNFTVGAGDTVTCTITNTANKATPSGLTYQHWVIFDTVHIGGVKIADGGAKVSFYLYKNDNKCETTPVGSNLDQDINFNAGLGKFVSTTGTGVMVTDQATYYWKVHYPGNAFNDPFDKCSESTTISAVDDTPPPAP